MGKTWRGSTAGWGRERSFRLILLLLLCALSVMAGCGGKEEPPPRPVVERAAPPTVEEPAEDVEPVEEDPPQEEEAVEPEEAEEVTQEEETPAALFTQEGLEELVQQTLEKIITPEMTQMEQAKAVWDFAKGNIRYTGTSDKSDWQAGAYVGLSKRRGDCFTYYAVSRALLTALDIENLEVQRVGGKTSHYWNLVNCGDGWYHFDATPRNVRMPRFTSFMFTDADAAAYDAMAGWGYYTFDGSLYPERGEGPPAVIRPPLPQTDPEDTEDPELDGLDPEDGALDNLDPDGQDPENTEPEGTNSEEAVPDDRDPVTPDPEAPENPVPEPSDGPELGTQEEGETSAFPPEPALPQEDAVPPDGGEPQPELGAED